MDWTHDCCLLLFVNVFSIVAPHKFYETKQGLFYVILSLTNEKLDQSDEHIWASWAAEILLF